MILQNCAKFKSYLLKNNGDIAPQSSEILRHLYGGGTHHTNVCECSQLCGVFARLRLSLSTLVSLPILRRSFQWCRRIFSSASCQKLRKLWNGLSGKTIVKIYYGKDNATTQRQMETRKRAERRLKATSVLNYLLCLASLVF